MTSTATSLIQPPSRTEFMELFDPALGEDALTIADLPLIKWPTGGTLSFELPSLDGPVSVREITGVVLDQKKRRSMWLAEIGEGEPNAPPDCASDDGRMGEPRALGEAATASVSGAEFGGDCEECPLNEFGSGKGDSKKCTERREVMVKLATMDIPIILRIPPSSLRAWRSYVVLVRSARSRLHRRTTTFSLEKKDGPGGPYAHLVAKGAEGDAKAWDAFVAKTLPALLPAPAPAATESAS